MHIAAPPSVVRKRAIQSGIIKEQRFLPADEFSTATLHEVALAYRGQAFDDVRGYFDGAGQECALRFGIENIKRQTPLLVATTRRRPSDEVEVLHVPIDFNVFSDFKAKSGAAWPQILGPQNCVMLDEQVTACLRYESHYARGKKLYSLSLKVQTKPAEQGKATVYAVLKFALNEAEYTCLSKFVPAWLSSECFVVPMAKKDEDPAKAAKLRAYFFDDGGVVMCASSMANPTPRWIGADVTARADFSDRSLVGYTCRRGGLSRESLATRFLQAPR